MKVLLDHDVPAQLRLHLKSHLVLTARTMHWDRLSNGRLLAVAAADGFEVMITGDQNLKYQQNDLLRVVSLIFISQTRRNVVLAQHEKIAAAISRSVPGSYELVELAQHPLTQSGSRS